MFLFFREDVEFFYFMGFFVCLFPDWVSYCVYGFVSWIYLFFFWIWRLGLVVGFGFGVCLRLVWLLLGFGKNMKKISY